MTINFPEDVEYSIEILNSYIHMLLGYQTESKLTNAWRVIPHSSFQCACSKPFCDSRNCIGTISQNMGGDQRFTNSLEFDVHQNQLYI